MLCRAVKVLTNKSVLYIKKQKKKKNEEVIDQSRITIREKTRCFQSKKKTLGKDNMVAFRNIQYSNIQKQLITSRPRTNFIKLIFLVEGDQFRSIGF